MISTNLLRSKPMRGRRRARFARVALGYAIALALAAAAACGVETTLIGAGSSSGSSGGPDASSADAPVGEGGAPADSGDAGSVVTTFGDASLSFQSTVDLLAGGGAVRLLVALDKEPGDPSAIDDITITPTTEIEVSPQPASSPTFREFDLTATANAAPQRASLSISATVGGKTKPLALTARVSRHFRAAGEFVITDVPSTSPPTTFEIRLWGAGGGSTPGGAGGAGGYARATVSMAGTVTVRVGGPGAVATGGMFGGGGAGANAAGGGGYSGVFEGGSASVGPTTLLLMAAGGGGGGSASPGGSPGQAGGIPNGGGPATNAGGGSPGGGGGTGASFLGGDGSGVGTGGGGGAGFFGGGGGGDVSGGGGGFSYAKAGVGATYDNGSLQTPGASANPQRQSAGNVATAGAVLIITN